MLKIAHGSVKDIYLDSQSDELHFLFSNRISVFDYGALPEEIKGRDVALARFAKAIFAKIKTPHLYLGDSSLGPAALRMAKATHEKFPSFSANTKQSQLHFVPLEIIFRWGVPHGSKLLSKGYTLFQKFEKPLVQYTTKLESFDRDLQQEEATSILESRPQLKGLTLKAIDDLGLQVATELKNVFSNCGLTLWDGKLECAWNLEEQKLYLVDAFTPDEVRLTLEDFPEVPLSKEILRNFFHRTTWPSELAQLKKAKGDAWKEKAPAPPALGAWRLSKLEGLYSALAQSLEESSPSSLLAWMKEENNKPKVHVVGNGGREDALKWKLREEGCEVVENPALEKDCDSLDAVLVSTDGDLEAGLSDKLRATRYWTLGPSRAAAQLEWSKKFGKKIATRAGIPLARWTTNLEEALLYPELPVIKLDGLAAGKGVVVPGSKEELIHAYEQWKGKDLFFEERLSGPEASVFFWIHPHNDTFEVQYLGSAQDFKRRFDGDRGPNTGGMGVKAPSPLVSADDIKVFQQWALSSAIELQKEGISYSGFLFLGFMKDPTRGWNLLEYNARMGDPETEALVLLWKNKKFLRSLMGLSLGANLNPELSANAALCVALVHPDYPEKTTRTISLPFWKPEEGIIFKTASQTGRLAYLCLEGNEASALSKKAENLLEKSPWVQLVEWRKDLLK